MGMFRNKQRISNDTKGTFASGAASAKEAIMKKNAAKAEKRASKQERRSLKKTARKDRKAAVKKIRKGEGTRKEKKKLIGAAKAFHSTDKEGKPGGFAAFGKYAAKKKAKEDRKTARKARKLAKREARNK